VQKARGVWFVIDFDQLPSSLKTVIRFLLLRVIVEHGQGKVLSTIRSIAFLIRNVDEMKRLAAFHEAGHVVSAKHLRVPIIFFHIKRVGNTAYGGRVVVQPTTPFRAAVIGWSGPIAEKLAQVHLDKWSEEALLIEAKMEHHFATDFLFSGFSEEDIEVITGHPQRWRALQTARRIVVNRREEVAQTAQDIIINAANAELR
jgi:hypothetical protein